MSCEGHQLRIRCACTVDRGDTWPWILRPLCSLLSSCNLSITFLTSGSGVSTMYGGPSPHALSTSSSASSSAVVFI